MRFVKRVGSEEAARAVAVVLEREIVLSRLDLALMDGGKYQDQTIKNLLVIGGIPRDCITPELVAAKRKALILKNKVADLLGQKNKKWSRYYRKCVSCNSKKYPHVGLGWCSECYRNKKREPIIGTSISARYRRRKRMLEDKKRREDHGRENDSPT